MRRAAWWGTVTLGFLAGCAPIKTPVAESSAERVAEPTSPTSFLAGHCVDGTTLVYQRPLDGSTELKVVLRCEDDQVIASARALTYPVLGRPAADDEGEREDLVEGGEDEWMQQASVDPERFGALVKLMQKRIEAGRCRPVNRWTTWAVGVGNDKWRIMCDGRALDDATLAFERAVRATFDEIDPREALPEEEATPAELWPFQSDYWRDELGYYRPRGG